MTARPNRLTAVDFLQRCLAAIHDSEQASDPAQSRRHARRALRMALLGEKQARLDSLAERRPQRTGFSSN